MRNSSSVVNDDDEDQQQVVSSVRIVRREPTAVFLPCRQAKCCEEWRLHLPYTNNFQLNSSFISIFSIILRNDVSQIIRE